MKNIKITQLLIIALLALSLTSCLGIFCVDGNGQPATEERSHSGFIGISNETSATVYFESGDDYTVFVEADENLLDYIFTSITSGILEIEIKGTGCIRPDRQPIVYITSPGMESIYSSGSGDIFADTVSGNRTEVLSTGSGNILIDYIESDEAIIKSSGSGDISLAQFYSDDALVKNSGSGNITIEGEGEMVEIRSTGSGETYCDDLESNISDISITGSGNVHAWVVEELIAHLSGSGNLYYYGNPTLSSTVTGSGRVTNLTKR